MKRYLISAAFLAGLGFTACDGNDEDTPKPDTIRPDTSDTTQPDTDTTLPDSITPPDIDATEPQATVKYARTLVAQEACTGDFRNDIDPQSKLDGVIVTSPIYDASPAAEPNTRYGFYVADADGGSYSGILVIANAPKPELVVGDVVDVSGQLMEAFCNAQVSNATVTKKSSGTAPEPLVQNATDLPQDAYEGMLVKVLDAEIEAITAEGQGKRIKGTNLPISFVFEGFIGLNNGSTYDITGVVRSTRFNGVEGFQLVPRGPSDVVLKNAASNSIVGIQGSAISTSCPNPDQQFVNGPSGIQFEGTVLVGNHYVTGTLDGYIITDGTQDPYSAVLISVANSPTKTDFQVGDQVRVIGDHQEFYCNTQIRASSVTKIGGPLTVPEPVVLEKNLAATELEKYEGMLVEMQNVVAGQYNSDKRGVTTDAGIDIDYGIMSPAAFGDGAAFVGKTLTSVRGIVRFSRSSYRISPRSAADWVIAE